MLGGTQPLFVAPSLGYGANKLFFWYFCTAILGIGWKLKMQLPLCLSTIPRIHSTCRGFECHYFRNFNIRWRKVFTFCVPTGLQILYVSYLAIMSANGFTWITGDNLMTHWDTSLIAFPAKLEIFDIHVSVYHDIIYKNDQQDATV